MIKISENSKVFVICPANFATGGPELLHQLVHKLNKNGFTALMYYINTLENKNPVHQRFKKYQNPYVTSVKDDVNHILILPEVNTNLIYSFPKSSKIIWWLSVDNFFIDRNHPIRNTTKQKLKRFFGISKRYNFETIPQLYHLAQSYYAKDFLEKKKTINNVGYLSDYLNSAFLSNSPNQFLEEKRENIVVYNPKKGLEKVETIKALAPEINWQPIQNMTPKQVVELLQKSKVYIDFGFHPGKDRIPREAAISGCCVITNKEGAANFYEDVPLKDEYKFKNVKNNELQVIEKIKDCFKNYAEKIHDFENYREMIRNEEEKFEKDILNNFKKV